MYLIFVLILFTLIGLFGYLIHLNRKEGFDQNLVDVLPIQISEDNSTISIPNLIKGNNGDDITFGGNITAPIGNTQQIHASNYATLNNLTVNGDSQLNDTTINGQTRIIGSNLLELGANTAKSWGGNGTISYKTGWDPNALNIVGAENPDNGGSRKVHLWDDVEVDGNLQVNGVIQLGNGSNIWTIKARDNGWLEFLYNNTDQDDPSNDIGRILMSPSGDLWLSRSSYPGWIADNLNSINTRQTSTIAQAPSQDSGDPSNWGNDISSWF